MTKATPMTKKEVAAENAFVEDVERRRGEISKKVIAVLKERGAQKAAGVPVTAGEWPPALKAKFEAAIGGGLRPVTIRLDVKDIRRAEKQAAAKGLRYQTYIKMLLHEALAAG
jgi:hypothetical protein